ncbi:hypothetical protein [Hymenobacter fodinae]|uniref:Rubredoxin-like domain-containing protein n=1 Tax=Hymenobacter fodinae TaxID=2510796 RepID=A0A4Z0P5H9_9BACT|nr:hypothetical protein [Hymenobacter fodinae]TGE06541.1 hypothetical protein EU556_17055 [Hymenobacter fodinae]
MEMWYCRVCGLDYDVSPWGEDGHTPDYTCCACCGAQFGIDDYNVVTAQLFRATWLTEGAPWFYANLKPSGWQLAAQLPQIPLAYQ